MPSETSKQSPPSAASATTAASATGDRSSSSKRRRTSDRSTLAVADQTDAGDARSSPGPRALTRGSPQRGSSREMTPPESSGSIKYTRTGRVSKATKGQRVHHCDNCGKTYTRAEHLRRHQQNHKPGAFLCDVPGCGRSFYREDLLVRHRARHDDPNNPPSRPQSRASEESYPPDDPRTDRRTMPTPATETPDGPDTVVSNRTPSTHPPPIGRPPRNSKGPVTAPNVRQHNNTIPIPANDGIDLHGHFGNSIWDTASPPPRYDSPTNNEYEYPFSNPVLPYYNQPHADRVRQASHTSYPGYSSFPQAATTPDSAGSVTACLPHWACNAHDYQGNLNNSSDSEGSYTGITGYFNAALSEQVFLPGLFFGRIGTAAERDAMERDLLVIPSDSPHDSLIDLSLSEPAYSNEDRYLGAYWLWVHPLYPVVHRPTFSLNAASPLLKAAMLALGAHALGDASDKTNARLVHERCLKVLKRRTANDWHSFRLRDMQAVVLVEIYALLKSRRPPLQFSRIFEDVYRHLASDSDALNIETAYLNDFLDDPTHIEDVSCKQRLLAACFVLDSQHTTLFGRRRTSCYPGVGIDLPFPTSQSSWDDARRPVRRLEPHERVSQALDGGNMDGPIHHRPSDVFQSMLMIACLTDSSNETDSLHPSDPSKDLIPVLGAMQQSAQIKLAYNTFMLCKYTPVRNLLAVAGESWVMAEKLSNQADFVASQIDARDWASAAGYPSDFDGSGLHDEQSPPVRRAFRHALRIIELHMGHPKTGLLYQEWSVYLAAVVVWAYAYASASAVPGMTMQRPRLSVPNPSQPSLSSLEIEQTVNNVVSSGGNTGIDQEEARRVLLWAKAAIERVDLPHNCGLTNGALDVLGKLVTRGTEGGWFGA